MKQILLFTLIVFSLGACKKNDNQDTEHLEFGGNNNSTPSIKTNETVILNPKITGPALNYEWLEDGKVISKETAYVFQRETPGEYNIILNVSNASSTATLNYKIKVVGIYANGILLVNGTDVNGIGAGNISFLDENENVKLNVFTGENKTAKMSTSVMGAFRQGNQLYLSSSKTPFIQVVNDETLKLGTANVASSSVTNLSYFATVDGKTGYAIGGSGSRRGFYAVDITANTVGTTVLSGTSGASLVPITTFKNAYLIPVAKKIVKVENGVAQDLFTYAENAVGLVKTANKQIWVGVAKGSSQAAKMVRLDENLAVQETIDLGSTFLLPQNGVLTASGTDEFIYWQETSTGDFCRFNTTTKTAEKFVSPAADGLVFATAWKVNPKTGELFLADSPGLFGLGDAFSDLYIYGKDKKLRKKIAKAGYQIVDIVFPK